jgi:hypothetical protein
MTLDEVKKSGMNLHGVMPLPREVSFPLGKGEYWHDYYDLIRLETCCTFKLRRRLEVAWLRQECPSSGGSIFTLELQSNSK